MKWKTFNTYCRLKNTLGSESFTHYPETAAAMQ